MSASILRNAIHTEPRVLLAGGLAVLVHLIFVALMIFSLNWKDHPPEGMTVDIWSEIPKPVQEPVKSQPLPKQTPKPEPQPEPQPPKPEPEPPKPEAVKPAPQPPKAVVSPPVKKPDIALKQKPEPVKETQAEVEEQKKKEQEKIKEQEKLKKEQEKQKELEKKKELEKQKEIEKRKEQEKQKEQERQKELEKQQELKKQKEKELAAQQRQRELEAKAQREAEVKRAAQQAAARAQITNEISKYKALILAKIRSRIVMPPDLPGNPVAEFNVTLLPGGDILDVRLSKSSGHAVFDSAVERAIFLSKPLPLPPDPALFNEFRNLNITVHYRE